MFETIELKRKTTADDTQGGRARDWSTLDTVSAEFVDAEGSESLQASAVKASTKYRLRIRAFAGLTTKDRLTWTPRWPDGQPAQVLEILAVLPDPKDRGYQFLDCATTDEVIQEMA